jgi:hypothetical protein
MPSMSPITTIGSGAARSRTKSHSPCSHTRSMRSSQISVTWSRVARTRAGVKPRLTSLRRFRWPGASMSIIHGIGPVSGRLPPALENVAGSRPTAITPA